jgi:hypothetical protein
MTKPLLKLVVAFRRLGKLLMKSFRSVFGEMKIRKENEPQKKTVVIVVLKKMHETNLKGGLDGRAIASRFLLSLVRGLTLIIKLQMLSSKKIFSIGICQACKFK